jgi:hypothetical protein
VPPLLCSPLLPASAGCPPPPLPHRAGSCTAAAQIGHKLCRQPHYASSHGLMLGLAATTSDATTGDATFGNTNPLRLLHATGSGARHRRHHRRRHMWPELTVRRCRTPLDPERWRSCACSARLELDRFVAALRPPLEAHRAPPAVFACAACAPGRSAAFTAYSPSHRSACAACVPSRSSRSARRCRCRRRRAWMVAG